MESKIDKNEMQILADELDKEVRILEVKLSEMKELLETKKMYATSARQVFLGLEYGGIK